MPIDQVPGMNRGSADSRCRLLGSCVRRKWKELFPRTQLPTSRHLLGAFFNDHDDTHLTRGANRGVAPQAYDKWRHGNSFQTRSLQEFPRSKYLLRSEVSLCDQTCVDSELHWFTCFASRISTQKEPFARSEFTAALNLDMLDAGRSSNADFTPRD